jgi:hypothetical protein
MEFSNIVLLAWVSSIINVQISNIAFSSSLYYRFFSSLTQHFKQLGFLYSRWLWFECRFHRGWAYFPPIPILSATLLHPLSFPLEVLDLPCSHCCAKSVLKIAHRRAHQFLLKFTDIKFQVYPLSLLPIHMEFIDNLGRFCSQSKKWNCLPLCFL